MTTTTLIVLALLALGVGIVVWATRRKPVDRPDPLPGENDTAWNDPMSRADAPPPDTAARPVEPSVPRGDAPRH